VKEPRIRCDEGGAALPLAMITLSLLATLLIALSMLTATEPLIASNHLQGAQAQGLAEAGVERALWAVQRPPDDGGLPRPLPTPLPAPYDGSRLIALSMSGLAGGGFRLTILPGVVPNERQVMSVGWMPTDDPADLRPKAHRRITATLWRVRVPAELAPCALCALGELALEGSAVVDARSDLACGGKAGAWASGAVSIASGAKILGADGDGVPNGSADYRSGQPVEDADAWRLGDADLAALKRLARARGTYFQGAVVFDAAHPAPEGLIFVDSMNGAPVSATTPPEELARVEMRGGAFRGWLIVAGNIEITGDARLRGLTYAQDGFTYRGAYPGGIEGQVIAVGQRGGRTLLSRTEEGPALTFDCAAATDGDGTVPAGWRIKLGSYREPADS
jgi:hypothetical protein